MPRPLLNQPASLAGQNADKIPSFWNKQVLLGSNLDSKTDRRRQGCYAISLPHNVDSKCHFSVHKVGNLEHPGPLARHLVGRYERECYSHASTWLGCILEVPSIAQHRHCGLGWTGRGSQVQHVIGWPLQDKGVHIIAVGTAGRLLHRVPTIRHVTQVQVKNSKIWAPKIQIT